MTQALEDAARQALEALESLQGGCTDAELGRKIARANAVNKVWPLMGYALKEKLHAQQGLK